MAIDPSVVINVAAQWTGSKEFKKADSATDKLSKNVKNLGKNLGLALSVGAILAFGKAAVKAAAEDEKAQKQLALALKNVGLGRDVAASEAFIQKLQSEFGIVDDQLRPAYQSLAIATKSTSESQKLMNIALDVAAANSLDVGQVTAALSKAYLGNNTALGKLGIGISKADLKAGNFDDIMNKLAKTFKGAAAASADTFAGKMLRLGVSLENAKEILGKGLIDSLMIFTSSAGIEELQVKIEAFATSAANGFKKLAGFVKENLTLLKVTAAVLASMFLGTNLIVGIAALVTAIGTINKAFQALRATAIATAIAEMFALNPLGATALAATMVGVIAGTIKSVDILIERYNAAAAAGKKIFNVNPNEHRAHNKAITETGKIVKGITTEEEKALKAKKLQLAIDKARLLLGKASGIFDNEKIQLAAAEKNQAEQLGKVTNQTQLLQITNDLARLEIKKSMNDLEDAIASKDIAAITNATNKLNADLKILGALTGQKIKLTEIEDILKAILPKDLINLQNLNDAIALLKIIGGGSSMATHANPILSDPNASPSGFPTGTAINAALAAGSFVPVVGGGGYSSTAGNYAPSGFPGASGNSVSVVNNFNGIVGDPNAVAELIDQVVQNAVDRGTLRVA